MPIVHEGGAVVVKVGGDDEPRCLLVTAKREPSHWLFPKGHVEPGETVAETAQREAQEEAGITGRVGERLGETSFRFRDKDIHVEYFLIEFITQGPAAEGRQLRWCTYDEAIALVSFDNLRVLLERAWPRVLTLHSARRARA